MNQLLTNKDLAKLSMLVGREFKYVAGPNLLSNMLDITVYVVAEGLNIEVQGSTEELLIQEEWEDIFKLFIGDATIQNVQEALDRGNVFVKYKGEKINSVKVIQQEIRVDVDNKQELDIKLHTGLVIGLDSGFIYILAQDMHIPLLKVGYSVVLDQNLISNTANRFVQDLNQQVYVQTYLVDV